MMARLDSTATELVALASPGGEAGLAMALAQLDTLVIASAIEALTHELEAAARVPRSSADEVHRFRAVLLAGIRELARRAVPSASGPTSESGFQAEVLVLMNLNGNTGTPDQPMEVAIEKPASRLLHLAVWATRESRARSEMALVSIVFSAIWLEAYFNQLLELIDFRVKAKLEKAPPNVIAAIEAQRELERKKLRLPEKIDDFVTRVAGQQQDRGASPYQELALLIELRDVLVHCWPTRVRATGDNVPLASDRSNFKKTDIAALLERLANRRVLARDYIATTPPILEALRRPEVARWALEAAQLVARHVANCFSSDRMKQWANRENALSGVAPRQFRLTGGGIWWPISD